MLHICICDVSNKTMQNALNAFDIDDDESMAAICMSVCECVQSVLSILVSETENIDSSIPIDFNFQSTISKLFNIQMWIYFL